MTIETSHQKLVQSFVVLKELNSILVDMVKKEQYESLSNIVERMQPRMITAEEAINEIAVDIEDLYEEEEESVEEDEEPLLVFEEDEEEDEEDVDDDDDDDDDDDEDDLREDAEDEE